MDEHTRKVVRALEGNERVYFHPHEDTIGVWYGKKRVRVFDNQSWEQVDEIIVGAHPDSAESIMATNGFDREGRDRDNWTLVKDD